MVPDPHRYELAGFPVIAGNTDIGIEFGAVLTLTRFEGEASWPYLWNADLLLSTSVKRINSALQFVQQHHVVRLDTPFLLGGRLRLDTRASYERTVNMGYFTLGSSNALVEPPPGTSRDRYFEFVFEEARIRTIGRIRLTPQRRGWYAALAGALRYVTPSVYAASRLAQDLADHPELPGRRGTLLVKLGGGAMYDTRDSEFVTREGLFYQLGVAGTLGTSSEHIAYGEVAAVLAHYLPLSAAFSAALRVVGSVLFGRVPFYDLAFGGVFEPQRLFGGETGLRGVPLGRYQGEMKLLANTELRGAAPRFMFLGQRLRLGGTLFFDTGRLWAAQDGPGLSLKYGVGGGVFLQWGDAAIFRVDVAYSPDARAEHPSLPLGIYVADGLMF